MSTLAVNMFSLPRPGDIIADKYRIEALLGEGGMGAVFRAHHELMDKPVALKWLRPSLAHDAVSRDRFIREARAMARIRHPNVVEIYDVGLHGGALFLVMELLEGESFEALLGRKALAIPEALRLIIESMRGVAAAHRANIVHRDIKPENIFVVYSPERPEGSPKVLDFGVSKLTDDADPAAHITRSGATMGTPLYMSYEQMQGAAEVDARTDIYSFGVLLYRTLTGRLPFQADSFFELAIAMASQRPASPKQLRPELPAELDRVVMKAIALDRAQRHATLDELVHELSLLASTAGFMARVSRPLAETPRTSHKGPGLELGSDKTDPASSTPPINLPTRRESTWTKKRGRRYALALATLAIAALAGAKLLQWRAANAPVGRLEPAAVRGAALPVPVTPIAAPTPEVVVDKTPGLPAGLSAPDAIVEEPILELPRTQEPARKPRRAKPVAPLAQEPVMSRAQPTPAVIEPANPSAAPSQSATPSQSAEGTRSGTLRRDRL